MSDSKSTSSRSPARLVPALDAFAAETLDEFREEFGTFAFEEFLAHATVCTVTCTLKPECEEAWIWFLAHATHFFLDCGVGVGEPRVWANG